MIVSASSGTTSQAIFSITSRLAFDSASRNIASPPSAGGGTTLRAGLCADEGTDRSGVGAGDPASSTSSSSSGISSSPSVAGGAGGLEATGGGFAGGAAGRPGPGDDSGEADVRAAGGPVTGGFAAGGLAAAGGAEIPGAEGGRGGLEGGGFDCAPAGMGGRDITIVLPLAPGETAGLAAGEGAVGRPAAAPGFAVWAAAGAMTGFAFGFARMILTCSISFPLSNGFGMWPLAPTAMALAGSSGAGPPRSSTGTSLSAASARTRRQTS